MNIEIYPIDTRVERAVTVQLPASKSLSARALVIASLAGCRHLVDGVAQCDDTDAIARGLDVTEGVVDIGAAGTAMRFLTAYYAAMPGVNVTLDGNARMRQRPIAPLVDALRQAGAAVDYVGEEGFPPLAIRGRTLRRLDVALRGDVSSQFVSGLMMVAPTCGGASLRLTTPLTSRPYVEMTAAMMRHYGAVVSVNDDSVIVGEQPYHAAPMAIEADWSAASYWYALVALVPGLTVRLPGLSLDSMQGDSRLATMMADLGVATRVEGGAVTISHAEPRLACSCPHAYYADMADVPDLAPAIVVTLCLRERAFRITGLHTLRVKETDRIEALCDELAKFGYLLRAEHDAISWHGQRCAAQALPRVDTHDDHRMAMAMAVAALARGGAVIEDAQVVTKSYPAFWDDLATLQECRP